MSNEGKGEIYFFKVGDKEKDNIKNLLNLNKVLYLLDILGFL